MKTLLVLIFAAFLTLLFAAPKVSSQTIAIGHVTAEVIESVSAASNAITSFELATIAESDARQLEQSYLTSENVNLGAITLHSGKNISCNVVVKTASLVDSAGNGFTLEPSVNNNSYASAAKADGSQTIQLAGKTNKSNSQASGLYHGSYTVVFAYN
ncbi:MAG TPA: hypothetical protein VFC67_17230 [Prolixibacteraceae bacterium]|nr:hypothetical protein [Prolixibacteraceae bacterium]